MRAGLKTIFFTKNRVKKLPFGSELAIYVFVNKKRKKKRVRLESIIPLVSVSLSL